MTPAAHPVPIPSTGTWSEPSSQLGAGMCTLTYSSSAPARHFSICQPRAELRALLQLHFGLGSFSSFKNKTANCETADKNPTRTYRIQRIGSKHGAYCLSELSLKGEESSSPLAQRTPRMIHSQPVKATSALMLCKQTDCFWLQFLSGFLHWKQIPTCSFCLSCYLAISL